MKSFEKNFTREASILAFEVWHENETKKLEKWINCHTGETDVIFHGFNGVTSVYYNPKALEEMKDKIALKLQDNDFLPKLLAFYREKLSQLKVIWDKNEVLKSNQKLINFFDLAVEAWSGLAISYLIPDIQANHITQEYRNQALAARTESETFFEEIDKIFKLTLAHLYPELTEVHHVISINDIRADTTPSLGELTERSKEFIVYKGALTTKLPFDDFLKQEQINIDQVELDSSDTISGTIAMKGIVQGPVRVVLKKNEIADVQEGEVLVTYMTTPDFLPAMKKAVAFITDEGGITCHAAIVAREMRKPCIIGTRVATETFKDGDIVEVDADNGIVRIL